MNYDGGLDLATGLSIRTKTWKNERWTWSDFVEKLYEGHETNETYSQFSQATKTEQLKIKDVGGYVGGYLRQGRRKPENVIHRQLITLDIDFAHMDFWDDFTLQFENAAVLHSTHSHTPEDPRFRLIMPISREVTPDEYVAISRYVAGILGIDLFDNTTFETNRLMFWPSNSKDVDYYYRFQDGPWADADRILGTYTDWTDSSAWPTAEAEIRKVENETQKQEDPETKKGIIGIFCRTYSISEAIETFLPDEYEPAGENRYTYTKGSTAAGLIVYDDKFAYSHHGTDPCSGKLCNAFDLVRIHKFGHLDSTELKGKPKSQRKMEEFLQEDEGVRQKIAKERFQEAKFDFAKEEDEEEDSEWTKRLDIDRRGNYLSTANNLSIIFAEDPHLKGKFRENLFDQKRYVWDTLPWREIDSPEPMKNVDYSGVRNYIERRFGIIGNIKIEDALALEFEKNSFHPVRDYLNGLEWDGQNRVDTLLIDYLGAKDSLYTREAIRKTLLGAVSRVFRPGCKFDYVLTLVGSQGTGKSTFVSTLGRQWFSDTFMTVQGKEALEQIQGAWIIEMAELSGLRKAEVETIKHFISKQEDQFRPAYARTSEVFKRQCIFIGTTNTQDFLRDPSGNRRFMPVQIDPRIASKSVFFDLREEVDQIWAETMEIYKSGEKLYLGKRAERQAREQQKSHSEVDDRKGIIEKYLETPLPDEWDEWDIFKRRTFLEDPLSSKGVYFRDYVCVAEIWCECLGKPKEDMNRYNTRGLNDIMRSLDDWEEVNSTRNFPIYGKQKYYQRSLQ